MNGDRHPAGVPDRGPGRSGPSRPRKWRRALVWLTAGLLALAILLPTALVLALGSAGFRQAVLVEEEAGVRPAARDFRVGIRQGVLELEAAR